MERVYVTFRRLMATSLGFVWGGDVCHADAAAMRPCRPMRHPGLQACERDAFLQLLWVIVVHPTRAVIGVDVATVSVFY